LHRAISERRNIVWGRQMVLLKMQKARNCIQTDLDFQNAHISDYSFEKILALKIIQFNCF
jgi:hypothetical protein